MFLPNAVLAGSQLNKGPALCHLLDAAAEGEIKSTGRSGNKSADDPDVKGAFWAGARASNAAANGT